MKHKTSEARRRAVANYRARNRASGRCTRCGRKRGRSVEFCDACREKANRKHAAYVKRRVAEGRCIKCRRKRRHYAMLCDACQIAVRLSNRRLLGFKGSGRGRKPYVPL